MGWGGRAELREDASDREFMAAAAHDDGTKGKGECERREGRERKERKKGESDCSLSVLLLSLLFSLCSAPFIQRVIACHFSRRQGRERGRERERERGSKQASRRERENAAYTAGHTQSTGAQCLEAQAEAEEPREMVEQDFAVS